MKTAYISGAYGFIGRYLEKELSENGIEVTSLRRGQLPEKPADVFYHLAWECATGLGRSDPFTQLHNVEITLRTITDAYLSGCKKFVALGTIYEKLALPDKFGNADFYVLAKRHAHETADRLAKKLGIDFVWTTVCHPVGTGIKPEQMIAHTVRDLLTENPPKMGSADTWYDIVSVKDLALGLRLVGEHKLPLREYFIGSGEPRILRDYLTELPGILGVSTEINLGARPDDGLRFRKEWFNINTLQNDTGYAPRVTFNDAIKDVAKGIIT
jgi:nucleoside-diphosphate-sugar epimerase